VTGHASWETARDAIQQGAETYLSKPVNLSELRVTLERAPLPHLGRVGRPVPARVRERYGREAMQSAFRILGEGQLSLT